MPAVVAGGEKTQGGGGAEQAIKVKSGRVVKARGR